MAGGFTGGGRRDANGVARPVLQRGRYGQRPNVAATATVSHPVKQGPIQSLGVFVDTMIICSATVFIILISGPGDLRPGGAR